MAIQSAHALPPGGNGRTVSCLGGMRVDGFRRGALGLVMLADFGLGDLGEDFGAFGNRVQLAMPRVAAIDQPLFG